MDLPKVKTLTLRKDIVFTMEWFYESLPNFHNRDLTPELTRFTNQIEFDLRHAQNEFREIDFFKRNPILLDEVWFLPPALAGRILIRLRSYFESIKDNYNVNDHHVRMEVTVKCNIDGAFDGFVAMSIEPKNQTTCWIREGYIFPPVLTPIQSLGFSNLRVKHRVSDHISFAFPIERMSYFDYSRNDKVYLQPLFEVDKLVEHYLDYSDYVILPTLIETYLAWSESVVLSVKLDKEGIEQRWSYFRAKIEDHLRILFEKIKTLRITNETVTSKYYLAIVLHPPDPSMIEFDPFLVFEFVEVDDTAPNLPAIARTVEITGKIFEPHISTTNIIHSTALH